MSLVTRLVPLAVCTTIFVAACSDLSSPTQPLPDRATFQASKGSGGGGGSSGGGGSTTQLVVTTPPTANTTGTWVGTSDGPDIVHTYTFTLAQSSAGFVSGSGTTTTPFMTASYAVAGTVNGDTLMLYTGIVCSSCTLTPLYKGLVSSDGARVDGKFLNGGVSPVTLFKQ